MPSPEPDTSSESEQAFIVPATKSCAAAALASASECRDIYSYGGCSVRTRWEVFLFQELAPALGMEGIYSFEGLWCLICNFLTSLIKLEGHVISFD